VNAATVLIVAKDRILRNLPDDIGREDLCYYLCDDYAAFTHIRGRYADRITIRLLGDQFHKTLEEISRDFLEYSHRINSRNRSRAFWGTHLASRNSGAFPLLKHVVYLCCAGRILDRARGQRTVFICDSPALAGLIRAEAEQRALSCRVLSSFRDPLRRAETALRLIAKGCYFLISGLLQLVYARTLRNRRITEATSGQRCVLRSWVTAGSVDGGGRYRDRNFGILPDYLAEQGGDVWTIPLYFSLDRNQFAQMKLMAATGQKILMPEQYLTGSDIWATLRDGIRGLFPDLDGNAFQGRDIRSLIMEMHLSACLHPSYLSYNSIRYLLKNLARRGVRVDCFIYPLENNPPEKPFIIAVREHYPRARLIGFQHTAWLKEQLGIVLLPEELAYHPLPGRIACSGRRYLDILKAAGFPPDLLVPGPNLRYTDVNRFVGAGAPGVSGPQTLLIILNYDANQNMELLEKAGQALKNPGDLRVLIKAHPTTDVQRISGFLRGIRFPRYEWASGTVMEQLAGAHAVMMTGGSVSSMEAIAAGVPLVRVSLENNFDFDCLWDDGPAAPPASSAGDLRRHLDEALGAGSTERERLRQYGKTMVESYFEPVTVETLQVFL
jgi:surface carbohydrate biosynthesis protein (TIGR04326 family)